MILSLMQKSSEKNELWRDYGNCVQRHFILYNGLPPAILLLLIRLNGGLGALYVYKECPDCKLQGVRSQWLKPAFSKCPFYESCFAIQNDIYDILQPNQQATFVHVGEFEDRNIFVSTPKSNERLVRLNWGARQGFTGCEKIQCYQQRLSQNDKAQLIDSAQTTVIDFGTTLNTCSNYLFSTERPIPYRDAVYRLQERGGSFVYYMLEPNSEGSKQLVALRKEDTEIKLQNSLSRFQSFKSKNLKLTQNFKVFQMSKNPKNDNMNCGQLVTEKD